MSTTTATEHIAARYNYLMQAALRLKRYRAGARITPLPACMCPTTSQRSLCSLLGTSSSSHRLDSSSWYTTLQSLDLPSLCQSHFRESRAAPGDPNTRIRVWRRLGETVVV